MIVLGEERAGKTSLVKSLVSLLSEQYEQVCHQQSTLGFESVSLPLNNHTQVLVWDFAGQLEYLPCHRHFLSSTLACYLVVVDVSKSIEEQMAVVNFWLTFLEDNLGPSKPTVMLVGTKSDQCLEDVTNVQFEDMSHRVSVVTEYFQSMVKIYSDAISFSPPNKEWCMTSKTDTASIDLLWKRIKEMVTLISATPTAPISIDHAWSLYECKNFFQNEVVVSREELSKFSFFDLQYWRDVGEVLSLPRASWVALNPSKIAKVMSLFTAPENHVGHIVTLHHTKSQSKAIATLMDITKLNEANCRNTMHALTDLGICFSHITPTNEKEYIFPCLLPVAESLLLPSDELRASSIGTTTCRYKGIQLSRRRSNNNLPISIEVFYHLLKFCWKLRDTAYPVCRNGVILRYSGESKYQNLSAPFTALLVFQTSSDNGGYGGYINIVVRGDEPEQFLTSLKTTFVQQMQELSFRLHVEDLCPKSIQEAGNYTLRSRSKHSLLPEEIERGALLNEDLLCLNRLWGPVFPSFFSDGKPHQVSKEHILRYFNVESHSLVVNAIDQGLVAIRIDGVTKNPILRAEYERVTQMFYQLLQRAKGGIDLDYEVTHVVVVFNPQLERDFFHTFMKLYHKKDKPTTEADEKREGGCQTFNSRQQRTLDFFSKGISPSLKCGSANLTMAWHGHVHENLWRNMVFGQFIPKECDEETIKKIEMKDLSKGDMGFFGRGAYFTQYPPYAAKYLRDEKVLQLSWLLAGDPYPVTEPIHGPGTMHGKQLKAGFDSHYAIVNRHGFAAEEEEAVSGDEFVLFRKEQVLPRYLVYFERSKAIVSSMTGRVLHGTPVKEKLPEAPVLICISTPHHLALLRLASTTEEDTTPVEVKHFLSPDTAMIWMLRRRDQVTEYHLKSHSLRIVFVNEGSKTTDFSGRRFYKFVRGDPDWRTIPFLFICESLTGAGFSNAETLDSKLWCQPDILTSFSKTFTSMAGLPGVPLHYWRYVSAPALLVQLESIRYPPPLQSSFSRGALHFKLFLNNKLLGKTDSILQLEGELAGVVKLVCCFNALHFLSITRSITSLCRTITCSNWLRRRLTQQVSSISVS